MELYFVLWTGAQFNCSIEKVNWPPKWVFTGCLSILAELNWKVNWVFNWAIELGPGRIISRTQYLNSNWSEWAETFVSSQYWATNGVDDGQKDGDCNAAVPLPVRHRHRGMSMIWHLFSSPTNADVHNCFPLFIKVGKMWKMLLLKPEIELLF